MRLSRSQHHQLLVLFWLGMLDRAIPILSRDLLDPRYLHPVVH